MRQTGNAKYIKKKKTHTHLFVLPPQVPLSLSDSQIPIKHSPLLPTQLSVWEGGGSELEPRSAVSSSCLLGSAVSPGQQDRLMEQEQLTNGG